MCEYFGVSVSMSAWPPLHGTNISVRNLRFLVFSAVYSMFHKLYVAVYICPLTALLRAPYGVVSTCVAVQYICDHYVIYYFSTVSHFVRSLRCGVRYYTKTVKCFVIVKCFLC